MLVDSLLSKTVNISVFFYFVVGDLLSPNMRALAILECVELKSQLNLTHLPPEG